MIATRTLCLLGLAILLGTPAAAFAQIPTNNLLLWFRADAGVTVDGSGNVTGWEDQSPSGNDAWQTALTPGVQPTLITNALNGLPVLRFDSGSTDHLRITNSTVDLTTGLSIFIIAKNEVRKDFNGGFRIGPAGTPFNTSSDLEIYWQSGTTDTRSGNLVYLVNRDAFPASPPFGQLQGNNVGPAVNNPYLLDVVASTSAATQRLNGVVSGAPAFGTYFLPSVANYATLGVGYGGGAQALQGDIAEVVVYGATLSTAERNLVAARLADKYGLSIPEPGMLVLVMLAFSLLFRRRNRA